MHPVNTHLVARLRPGSDDVAAMRVPTLCRLVNYVSDRHMLLMLDNC